MRPHKTEHTPGKPNHNLTLDEFQPYLLFLLLCILIISSVRSARERSEEPVRFSQKPVFSTEFGGRKPYAVAQIIEAGEYLYVLPSDHAGFVQVYDLKGTYQHSLFFLEKRNGGFSMASEGDIFYFRNQSSDVFVFRNGEFIEYVQWKTARERFPHVDFERRSSTPGYVIRGTDLWRVSADREELVMADFVRFDASFAVVCIIAILSVGTLWLVAGWIKRNRTNR